MDASTGTFLSVDPLVAKTGQAYLYGAGNPVTYSDPTGLCAYGNYGGYSGDDGKGACPTNAPSGHDPASNSGTSAPSSAWERTPFGGLVMAACADGNPMSAQPCAAQKALEQGKGIEYANNLMYGWDVLDWFLLGRGDSGGRDGLVDGLYEGKSRVMLVVGQIFAAARERYLRAPDYVVVDTEAIGAGGLGLGPLLVLSRSGRVYVGPQGLGGAPGVSVAVRGGYVDGGESLSGADIDSFIDGWGITVGATSTPFSAAISVSLDPVAPFRGGDGIVGVSGELGGGIGEGASVSLSFVYYSGTNWLSWAS